MEFKRNAISFAEKHSNNAAAKKFCVDRKRIREWKQNKSGLFDSVVKASSKMLEGGVKPVDVQLENQLVEWIYGRRSNGLRVSRKFIIVKAKSLHDESSDADESETFVASTGWLNNFILFYFLFERDVPK